MKATNLKEEYLSKAVLGQSETALIMGPLKERYLWEDGKRTDKFDCYVATVILHENGYEKLNVKVEKPSKKYDHLADDEVLEVNFINFRAKVNFKNEITATCESIFDIDLDETRQIVREALGMEEGGSDE